MSSRFIVSLLAIVFSLGAFSQTGSIRGRVFDNSGEFLPGVTVFIEGTTNGTITDLDGNFNLKVAPGTYTVRVSYISYETLNLSGVVVKENEVTALGGLKMQEATIGLNSVTITAKKIRNTETALLSVKRKSANLMDGISSANFKLIGDSDAAGAVKRVPGVSISGGKYVYVRGLGDRYTKTVLNGTDIPGLDPDRNTLQMDIFPTNVIDNIIVHKSFSADLPADFTGGVIDIEIKSFPDKKEGALSLGAAYSPGTHFNTNYVSYKGGKTDFLGFDDGTRAIPAQTNIPQFAQVVGSPSGEKGQRYQEILKGFNPTMAASRENSFMDYSLGFSYGNQKPKENVTLGYNLAFSYKNSTEFYKDAIDGKYGLSIPDVYEMEVREYQIGDLGINNVLLSGLAGFALKTTQSKYRLNILHLQNGESKAGIFDFNGSDQGSDFNAFQQGLDYSQRALSNILLDGKHSYKEGEWKIEWKLSPTLSQLEDPDIRFTRYEITGENSYRIGTEVGFPERIWRELNEISLSGLFHVTKEFDLAGKKSKLKFGGLYTYKQRDYVIQNYSINPRDPDKDTPLSGNPNELFFEENLWPRGGNELSGTTYETPFIPNNPNQFDANSTNIAGYVLTELSISQKLKTILGIRLENFTQRYTGSDQQRTNELDNDKVLDDINLFPSLNLLYQLNDYQNLRLSYTQTIARPSFKELSYAEIYDPISGNTFIGSFNKDENQETGTIYWDGNLVSTKIRNIDLRWELFQKNGQLFSASAFYKIFENPIEIVQYTIQIGAFQPRNVGDGKVYGGELEFRKNLGFLSEKISGLQIFSNATIAVSSIALSETEFESRSQNARRGQTIASTRRMAGQAPYLINSGISYTGGNKDFWSRLRLGLYYNVQGPTLEIVGAADRPDIYSEPFHSLNFNSSILLLKQKKMQLGFKVSNILGAKKEMIYTSFQAQDKLYKSRETGRKFSMSLSYRF